MANCRPAHSIAGWKTPSIAPNATPPYNLVVEWDQFIDRHFEQNARLLITMLRKAIFQDHSTNHRITHFETSGVVVKSYPKSDPPPEPKPISNLIM